MSSKYTPTKWVARETIGTASVMNNIEQGIVGAYDEIEEINNNITNIENTMSSAKKPGWKTVTLAGDGDVGEVVIDELDAEDCVVYRIVAGAKATINGIKDNLPAGSEIYFLAATASSNASLTLNNGKNLSIPGNKLVISANNGNNEYLFRFIKVSGSVFRLVK